MASRSDKIRDLENEVQTLSGYLLRISDILENGPTKQRIALIHDVIAEAGVA